VERSVTAVEVSVLVIVISRRCVCVEERRGASRRTESSRVVVSSGTKIGLLAVGCRRSGSDQTVRKAWFARGSTHDDKVYRAPRRQEMPSTCLAVSMRSPQDETGGLGAAESGHDTKPDTKPDTKLGSGCTTSGSAISH
jgi:hypothetical protein